VGQHTRILKSGRHEPSFYAQLWQTVTRGDSWSGTIVNRRKDGSIYQEEQTIAPVLDENGAITHFIAIKQDVTDQRRIRNELESAHRELAVRLSEIETLNTLLREQAVRDPLTGLHNRRYLEETMKRDIPRVRRSRESLVVATIDVDSFKAVNDLHGHAVGDRVLLQLADVLLGHVRTSDLVCRTGGEEFVVVLPNAGIAGALKRAEDWRSAFAACTVEGRDGAFVRTTISIGLARFRDPGESFAACLKRADEALYAAKRAGRNRVASAEKDLV
jgi:diguanylate cyclase (GGDEF)-like protein